ncbi:CD63 antigen-like [Belonocnema kinseyi]|uniref:CD63 antigen-like n=1 Tax=Belonocnema kinseyi TaxID=2817044 RepID=UPI00143CE4EB|nr:CD63 antigen-like [Belonocnema kinseyi]
MKIKMESCGMSAIKYFVFLFNLIFAISGIGVIAAGAAILADIGDFSRFLEARILAPPIVLIVAGVIVFIIAFLGCYGAIKENYNMLIAFSVALLIILIIELAVGIAAAVFRNDFSNALMTSLQDSMKANTQTDKDAWNALQSRLECCGVESSKDWGKYSPGTELPYSCCKDSGPKDSCETYEVSKIHETGCFAALEIRVKSGATALIGVGIGIAFIEIAGIVLACLLASSIKRGDEDK